MMFSIAPNSRSSASAGNAASSWFSLRLLMSCILWVGRKKPRLILFTSFGALINTRELESAGLSASIPKNDAGMLLMTAQALLKVA